MKPMNQQQTTPPAYAAEHTLVALFRQQQEWFFTNLRVPGSLQLSFDHDSFRIGSRKLVRSKILILLQNRVSSPSSIQQKTTAR